MRNETAIQEVVEETRGASSLARLVQLACRGDADAFASLHARFARSVHAILLSRLPAADADDAVQETFVLAWKRLETLREPEAVGPWLHAIARNVAVDRHRERARRGKEEVLHEETAGAAASAPDRGELRERVMAHLRSLPEAYRETLAMRLVEGLTGPEIAEATGLTAGSVRVNLCRGMDLLREMLKKEGWP
jgi:RNA polymerase sigma-70 factor (ECF subfamily)